MFPEAILSRKFAFLFPVSLFFLNITATFLFHNDSWFYVWIYSAILHPLGGAAMAILFFNFWENNSQIYSFKRKYFVVLIMALGFVALVGVLWELYEFALDYSAIFTFKSQQGLQDTMLDLFWDLVGGGVLSLFYLNSFLHKQFLSDNQEKNR